LDNLAVARRSRQPAEYHDPGTLLVTIIGATTRYDREKAAAPTSAYVEIHVGIYLGKWVVPTRHCRASAGWMWGAG